MFIHPNWIAIESTSSTASSTAICSFIFIGTSGSSILSTSYLRFICIFYISCFVGLVPCKAHLQFAYASLVNLYFLGFNSCLALLSHVHIPGSYVVIVHWCLLLLFPYKMMFVSVTALSFFKKKNYFVLNYFLIFLNHFDIIIRHSIYKYCWKIYLKYN